MIHEAGTQKPSRRFLMDFKDFMLKSKASLHPPFTHFVKSNFKKIKDELPNRFLFNSDEESTMDNKSEKLRLQRAAALSEGTLLNKSIKSIKPIRSINPKLKTNFGLSDNASQPNKKYFKIKSAQNDIETAITSQVSPQSSFMSSSSFHHPKSNSSANPALASPINAIEKFKLSPIIQSNPSISQELPMISFNHKSEDSQKRFISLLLYSNWLDYYAVSIKYIDNSS